MTRKELRTSNIQRVEKAPMHE